VWYGIVPAGDLQDVDNRWAAVSGVDADGAVLIRPDGFVAWRRRNAGESAQAELDAAFDRVLMRHEESQSGVNAHVMASAKT
jgi:hypothetical protein